MSTAFYKPKARPQLLASFKRQCKTLNVWTTSCIVHNFGKNESESSFCNILINPSNPELSGVSNFPYFPRGGPVPKLKPKSMHKDWQPMGYVSNWGGMDIGDGMLYPVSVIDGLVHTLGGKTLALECKMIHMFKGGCPIGSAVESSPGSSELEQYYNRIIHTTPPFYKFRYNEEGENQCSTGAGNGAGDSNSNSDDQVEILHQCYKSAFEASFLYNGIPRREECRVACPIIGAGARGFPYDVAINVAAFESWNWLCTHTDNHDNKGRNIPAVLSFGIPDPDIANKLSAEIKELEGSEI